MKAGLYVVSRNKSLVFRARDFPETSAFKESACNAGDPNSIPGLGRSSGEGIGYPVFLGFPCSSAGKESAHNAGDLGLICALGRSSWEGKGCPLRYSGLESSMDCIVTGSDTTERFSLNGHWKD